MRLRELLDLNENLLAVHLLKEDFAAFYQSETPRQAELFLEQWINDCQESGLQPFLKFAKQIQRWKERLLPYFAHPISNRISEGINTKIKILSATDALPSLNSITHCF